MTPSSESSSTDAQDLFTRARTGDQDAWKELFETCYPKVLRVIRRKLNSPSIRSLYDSTDFAGDVWKSLAANAERFDFANIDSLIGFLVKAVDRKLADEYRRQLSQKRDIGRNRPIDGDRGDRELPSSDPTPSQVAVVNESWERILAGLADEQEREVIRLKREGYSNEEITNKTGWHIRKVQRFLSELRDSSLPPRG
jgi:RNA polymerase sigma factor (sigma-70 family)